MLKKRIFGLLICYSLIILISCQKNPKAETPISIKFTNVTESAGVITRATLGGHGAIAGDVNGDGLVDLFYTNTVTKGQENLFINQGDGTFREESVERGADDPQGGSHGMVLVDFDCDGDFDIWNGATILLTFLFDIVIFLFDLCAVFSNFLSNCIFRALSKFT